MLQLSTLIPSLTKIMEIFLITTIKELILLTSSKVYHQRLIVFYRVASVRSEANIAKNGSDSPASYTKRSPTNPHNNVMKKTNKSVNGNTKKAK